MKQIEQEHIDMLNDFNEQKSLRLGIKSNPWRLRGGKAFMTLSKNKVHKIWIDKGEHGEGDVFHIRWYYENSSKPSYYLSDDLTEFVNSYLNHMPPIPDEGGRDFVEVREYNDWEQETWSFFVRKKGNEQFLNDLIENTRNLKMMSAFGGGEYNPLSFEVKKENVVDWYCSRSGNGMGRFLKPYTKVDRILEINDKPSTPQEWYDTVYKGGVICD